ncbi:putative MFS sugar transporter [Aaosphaeria arxii CBS 175.79]|uniref:Putative MFS sugar transporter n=1 Tax=Aaosphaeria arxii CBS 175.79 TaxID=1450172 RepID=A0A6A5Y022_9PLEO|nr:putative MFS sugar transporter [Aaosphaeria arxii CBS 175.79]KAF2018599.1 putative MFS sugar transporter [Aaosphaeria arxii CBS 175.79]
MKFNWFGRGLSLRIAITVACEMAFILFGYDQGVFSGIIGNEDFLKHMNYPGDGLMGIIVSIYNLGCFSGCIINFFIGGYLGRRRAMWLAMAWIIIGAVLQTTAYSPAHMMVARFLTGIGTGIETSTVPMYQAELSRPHQRGRLVCSEAMFVGVGIVIAYFFDYGMAYAGGPIAWRLPVACQIVFALVVVVLVFGLPESPRHLYNLDRGEEALQVLCDVYDKTPDDDEVRQESQDIVDAIALEQNVDKGWLSIFKNDELQTGKRVLLAYGMMFMQQVSGINFIVYYVPTALEHNVGLDRNLSMVLGGCIQCMFFLGSLIPSFGSDRLGRRMPMIVGSAILGFLMMIISILLSFQGSSIAKPTASASVAIFFIWMFVFGATGNCIPWVYVPEILPLRARAKGTALGISSNWLWNFVVVMITPTTINSLHWKTYLIWMCTNFSFVPLLYFFYPETKNLTLEEIDLLYRTPGRSARHIADELRRDKLRDGEKGFAERKADHKSVEAVEEVMEVGK